MSVRNEFARIRFLLKQMHIKWDPHRVVYIVLIFAFGSYEYRVSAHCDFNSDLHMQWEFEWYFLRGRKLDPRNKPVDLTIKLQ